MWTSKLRIISFSNLFATLVNTTTIHQDLMYSTWFVSFLSKIGLVRGATYLLLCRCKLAALFPFQNWGSVKGFWLGQVILRMLPSRYVWPVWLLKCLSPPLTRQMAYRTFHFLKTIIRFRTIIIIIVIVIVIVIIIIQNIIKTLWSYLFGDLQLFCLGQL